MKFGLLLPCKVVNIYDCTHYAVQLPGQSEVEVMLSGVADVLQGMTLAKAIDRIDLRIRACASPVLWLPQPSIDVGFYRSIREGGMYLGDILLNEDSLASYAVREGFAERLSDEGEWNGEEWVGRWNL